MTAVCASRHTAWLPVGYVFESWGTDVTRFTETLEEIRMTLSDLIQLDAERPLWRRLYSISLNGDELVDETAMQRLSSIVGRSPKIREVTLARATCPPSQWHPLIVFLRSLLDHTTEISSLQEICV